MMDMTYYQTIDKLEKMGTDKEYIQGWIGGFLRNPKREEQRITPGYEAGYNDGLNNSIEQAGKFAAAG